MNHGPGGQQAYGEVAEADPCFARIVPGFEQVVKRIHQSEVQEDDYSHMKHNVAIRSIRMVSRDVAKTLISKVNHNKDHNVTTFGKISDVKQDLSEELGETSVA